MGCRNEISLFVKDEYDRCNHRCFGRAVTKKKTQVLFYFLPNLELQHNRENRDICYVQARLHEFHRCRRPNTANQAFEQFRKSSAVP